MKLPVKTVDSELLGSTDIAIAVQVHGSAVKQDPNRPAVIIAQVSGGMIPRERVPRELRRLADAVEAELALARPQGDDSR